MPTPRSDNRLSPEALSLYNYFKSNFGKKIISGQMDLTWNDNIDEAALVYKATGKYPALMGFDFMNMLDDFHSHGRTQIEKAIAWAKGTYPYEKNYTGRKGGIVTFCWHWYVPSLIEGAGKSFYTNNSDYAKTDFRIPYNSETGLLDMNSYEFSVLKTDMDKVAGFLRRLKDEHIPVLWRPLHEASGQWFWWGCGEKESYKALWRYMVDYFTELGLDNLIWVCNCQDKNLYPGDEYADIVGEDIYATTPEHQDFSSQKEKFFQASNYGNDKIITLSETGTIPDIEEMKKDKALWSWFLVWNDCRIKDNTPIGDEGNFWSGELYNPLSHKKSVYNHPDVVTLETLSLK